MAHSSPAHRGSARRSTWGPTGLWLVSLTFAALAISLAPPRQARAAGGTGDLWQTFGAADGLPSANVSAALVARDGTLWFGTDAGAAHYDGAWTTLGEAEGLPAGRVRAIAQAQDAPPSGRGADGAFWLGVAGHGLARCAVAASAANAAANREGTASPASPASTASTASTADADSGAGSAGPATAASGTGTACRVYTTADGLPEGDVLALAVTRRGDLWAGTASGLARLPGGNVPAEPFPALAGVPVWALVETADGDLLVGTEGHGLWRVRDGQAERLPDGGVLDGPIYALLVDRQHRIWAGTGAGLFYASGGPWQPFPLARSAATGAEPRVFALAEDSAGGIWVGTEDGAFYQPGWPGAALERLTADDGLAANFVRALVLDPDGAVWLATTAGISRYAGGIWQVVREAGMDGRQVNAILADRQGRIWVGAERDGLAMWDGATWRLFAGHDPAGDRILALYEDPAGRVWVGTGAGAGYIECEAPACQRSRWQTFDSSAGLPAAPVWAIAGDGGRVWLGTSEGAAWWDEGSGLRREPGLGGWRINAIYAARDAVWFGTEGHGVKRLVAGRPSPVTEPPFKTVALRGIVEQPGGGLLVATYDNRLWQYAGDRWQALAETPAAPAVLSVGVFAGSVWAGTRNGFSRFDGRTRQLYTGSVLPNPEVRALTAGADGTVWIGTTEGLLRYRPERSRPWVRVESVDLVPPAGGRVALSGGSVRSVRLAAGDLGTRREDLVLLAEFVGVADGLRVATGSEVTYPDLPLPPGDYVLRVQARDLAFNYSDPVEVSVHMAQPGVWGTAIPARLFYPALTLAVLLVGGLAAGAAVFWRARTDPCCATTGPAGRQRDALARRFNPYISGEPVREPGMFFGRHELLGRIMNALHQNSIMISGERRIGKTTLLLQLAESLRQVADPEWAFVPVYVDLEGTPAEHFFALLMEEIVTALPHYLPSLPPLRFPGSAEYCDRDFVADLRTVLDRLGAAHAPRSVRLILLLDEMDVINGYDTIVQQQLRRIFMSSLAQHFGAVVAGVAISRDWDRVESPWYNLFNQVALAPLPREEAQRLLVEPVNGVYEWTPEAVEYVLRHAEGRPYRVQQYGLEAVNRMLAEGRTTITLADVRAAEVI